VTGAATPRPCLFCRIIAGQAPAEIVFQDERVTAIRDNHPQAPTHLLVMPNRHLASLAEAGAGDESLLGVLLLTASRLADEAGLAQAGFRLVVNTGAGAGQSVWHLHIHVIGGRALHWPPG
jgi:histidine triad (HIT) family protein